MGRIESALHLLCSIAQVSSVAIANIRTLMSAPKVFTACNLRILPGLVLGAPGPLSQSHLGNCA